MRPRADPFDDRVRVVVAGVSTTMTTSEAVSFAMDCYSAAIIALRTSERREQLTEEMRELLKDLPRDVER